MISQFELIDFARQNGFKVTVWQIKKWHQHGILPAPFRTDTKGNPGSVWMYPDSSKEALLLALTSDQRDTLDGLLLDVWLRGGDVNYENIQKMLLSIAQPIEKFVRNPSITIERFERFWSKFQKKKRLSPPLTNSNAVVTTMNVAFNAISQHPEDVVWGYEMPDDRDESAAAIADRLFGADQLRALSPSAYQETPEQWLDQIKQDLNAKRMVSTLKHATAEDFQRIRRFVQVMEEWIDGVTEVISIIPGQGSVFMLFKAIKVPKPLYRKMNAIVLLTLRKDDKGRQLVHETVESWTPHLARLNAWKLYYRHMKKHPKLTRRKNWVDFFATCSSDVLDDIRAHHEMFFEKHPELKQFIFDTQNVENRTS